MPKDRFYTSVSPEYVKWLGLYNMANQEVPVKPTDVMSFSLGVK
jgi:hypothetical protein